jgi:OmcA/MtrC family decaheme c-type cytochrome
MRQLSLMASTVPLLLLTSAAQIAMGQTTLDWNSSQFFRYNILSATYNSTTRGVTVVFSVTNPMSGNAPYDILSTTAPTYLTGTGARLAILIGWNTAGWKTTELVNTGNTPVAQVIARTWMTTPPSAGGSGPSVPKSINALSGPAAAKRCDDTSLVSPCPSLGHLTFFVVSAPLPDAAVGAGRVGMEGHAVIQAGVNIPIKSVYADFAIDATAVARRQVVDFKKCQVCHDDKVHGNTTVPRLSLHGGNRTEEPGLCVMCHNPNQTDAAYRSSGAEESVDFKRLVHGIHAGGFRRSPLVIIGFQGSVNDFSTVRFPAQLRNCTLCHIDSNGKGTFELPVASTLGSTINSGSALSPLPGFVDVNPVPDLKISPTAAACSACHDSSEVRRHMISRGASFGAKQADLGKEQCVNCHGPGREEDVRRAHEIRSSHSTSGDR